MMLPPDRQSVLRRRRASSAVVMVALMIIGAALGTATAARRSSVTTVAVLLSADVPAYTDAVSGFAKQFEHKHVATYDMKADIKRGARQLKEIHAKYQPDLVLAVGGRALQVASDSRSSVPTIYAMVLNPPATISARDRSIAGASMNVSVTETLDLLRELNSSIVRIGVIYHKGTTGHLVEDAKKYAAEHEMEIAAEEIRSPRDVRKALGKLKSSGIDALWIVPDKHILAQATFKELLRFASKRRVPVIGLSERHAKMGTLMALYFRSATDIGRQAGELAQRVADGEKPADIPFTKARKTKLIINLIAARRLGIKVPKAILDEAYKVIR